MNAYLKPVLLTLLLALQPLSVLAANEELTIIDHIAGDGEEALAGTKVTVNYTGWLLDGDKFDSSIGREPLTFTLGVGAVIPGWDEGVQGMKVGGKRELLIPPQLGYGERGAGKIIPPNSTLRFEIELLAVAPPLYKNISNEDLKGLQAKGVKLIDVRLPEEWKETGVIKGSVLIQSFEKTGRLRREFIEELAKTVNKDEPVILICRTGSRTGVLSEGLSDQFGYSQIYNVTKGIEHWIGQGNPVVEP